MLVGLVAMRGVEGHAEHDAQHLEGIPAVAVTRRGIDGQGAKGIVGLRADAPHHEALAVHHHPLAGRVRHPRVGRAGERRISRRVKQAGLVAEQHALDRIGFAPGREQPVRGQGLDLIGYVIPGRVHGGHLNT